MGERLAEAVAAVGAVAMICALLLPWWSVDAGNGPSGFELAVRVDVVIAAIALLILAAAGAAAAGAVPWLFPVAACVGGAFVAGLLLFDPIERGSFALEPFALNTGPDRGPGYYVELVSALLVAFSGGVAGWRNGLAAKVAAQ